jgi:hypothetical protein
MQLLAKLSDMHLDEMIVVLAWIVMTSPALLKEHSFGHDRTCVLHERDEQTELDGRERDLDPTSRYVVRRNVECQIADMDPFAWRHLLG